MDPLDTVEPLYKDIPEMRTSHHYKWSQLHREVYKNYP